MIRKGCPSADHDTKCALKKLGEIQEWLDHNSKYRILVTGRMGSGKTTFIRGLTEEYVPPTDSLLPHTTKVMPYDQTREGSNCIFFDTPGLKDDENSSNDYAYLREMVRKNGEPNLLVFAIKMDEFTFQEEDLEAVLNVSSAFGWKIWQRSMFILTFANVVQKSGRDTDSVESKLYFSKLLDKHQLEIAKVLRKNSVRDEVINAIPVVPVGLVSKPSIPADRREVSWIEEFWQEAFKILRKTKPTYTRSPRHEQDKEDENNQPRSYLSMFALVMYYIWVLFSSGFTMVFIVKAGFSKEKQS